MKLLLCNDYKQIHLLFFYTTTGNTDIFTKIMCLLGQLLMMYHHLLSARALYGSLI